MRLGLPGLAYANLQTYSAICAHFVLFVGKCIPEQKYNNRMKKRHDMVSIPSADFTIFPVQVRLLRGFVNRRLCTVYEHVCWKCHFAELCTLSTAILDELKSVRC